MTDDAAERDILVVFRNGQAERYQISNKELDSLSSDFRNAGGKAKTATYAVYQDGVPRVLMLNFADVLYIG